jgi:exosortase/archaeosortase family protein
MTSLLLPARTGVRRFLGEFTSEDRAVAQRARNLAIFIAVVVVAYHYSLSTLFRTLQSDTPLAYLGLVPVLALGLAATRARPAPNEPDIHDRQVDYIVGIPLLLTSLAVNIVLPVKLSSFFWIWRVDLLAFPLFVAGTIALLFGVRTLWRGRIPILFLFLAWPLPYTSLLTNQLNTFTDATVSAVRVILGAVPVAHSIPSTDGTLFQIVYHHKPFPVSVASACSGVNGVVGYALVAIAFLAIVKGKLWRKLAWLLTGLAVVWSLNVVRIIGIFAAGHAWGEKVAIDALHPYLGLVTFSIAVLIMLALLGRFGLEVNLGSAKSPPPDAPKDPPPPRKPAVPKTRLAVGIIAVLALLSGIVNTSLKSYDAVANAVGTPRLASFLTTPSHPQGWKVYRVAQFEWAKQFFGSDSTWWRYDYHWSAKTVSPFHSNSTVIADVISTSDLSSFSTYGIEACYNFHGFSLKAVNSIDLHSGVVGHVVAYQNNTDDRSEWTNVYWINPVNTPSGIRYERVNLMMINAARSDFSAPVPAPSVARSLGLQIENALSGGGSGSGPKLDRTRAFLAAFAADLIRHQRPAPAAGA